MSQSITTLRDELPAESELAPVVTWATRHVDWLACLAMLFLTVGWETSEYLAHIAELQRTGREPHEINMQWSLPDAITDSFSNLLGMVAAIVVRRRAVSHARRPTPEVVSAAVKSV